jgi:ribosomal-protein-alanine N-acetyltransferase
MAADPGEGAVLTLTAGPCLLRAWWKSDAASLVQHANNRNVAQHLRDRFPHPYTRAHATAFLGHAAGADVTTNFAIVVDDAAVGGIGYIRGADVERFSAEVGYWLGEAYWGRGIMTAALQRLTQHLFDDVKLLRAFALPLADNQGSVRVLEKAGYEREARLRASCVKYGQPRDQYLYARLNPRWRADHAPGTERD